MIQVGHVRNITSSIYSIVSIFYDIMAVNLYRENMVNTQGRALYIVGIAALG